MRYTVKIGTFFNIPVRVHFTFPLILIVFGLEAWVHGSWRDGLWALLLVSSIFVCVVLHELGHSLQVRRYGITVRDIILLPIGGMARAESIPEKPWQEIVVAISGPLVNFALAAIFLGILMFKQSPIDLETDFIANLFAINIVLGTFNLIPAFPMDGGRILRGLLASRMPYLKATRYAKNAGQMIALLFIVFGFLDNRFIMLSIIAVFVFFGAINEERMIKTKYALRGKTVGDFLQKNIPLLQAGLPLDNAASVFAGTHSNILPVTDEMGGVVGVVLRNDLSDALKAGKGSEPIKTILKTGFPILAAETPALQGYYFLRSGRHPFSGVVSGGAFTGLIFTDDIGASAS